MLTLLDKDAMRELQAIMTLYLATVLEGFNSGFPAVAVPDMKQEIRSNKTIPFKRYNISSLTVVQE